MTPIKQDIAILFSGGDTSVSLFSLCATGGLAELPSAHTLHLLHMTNGMSGNQSFSRNRYKKVNTKLRHQAPANQPPPETFFVSLSITGLLRRLWLDYHEPLMQRYNHKNLVCVACRLAMHMRAILYCVRHLTPVLLTGYSLKQAWRQDQGPLFMDEMAALSAAFGITTQYPLKNEIPDENAGKCLSRDLGFIPGAGSGAPCVFENAFSSATATETRRFLDDVGPDVRHYLEAHLEGRIGEAARHFHVKLNSLELSGEMT